MDQPGGVDLLCTSVYQSATLAAAFVAGSTATARWPGRICAAASAWAFVITPITGYPPVTGWSGPRITASRWAAPGSSRGRPLAGQLPVGIAVHQRRSGQAHTHPVAAVGGRPVGVHEGVGVGEPVVAWAGHHAQFPQLVGDRGDRRLVELGVGAHCAPIGSTSPSATGAVRSPTSRRNCVSPAPGRRRCRRARPGSCAARTARSVRRPHPRGDGECC